MRVSVLAVVLSLTLFSVGCDGGGTGAYGDNTSLGSAYEIEVGRRYESRIRRKNDREFFMFTTQHIPETFDLIEIDVDSVGPNLNILVEIFNSKGQTVTRKSSAGPGDNVTHSFVSKGDITYYLRFSGMDPETETGSAGEYSFTVNNLFANDEFVGNHTLEDACEMDLDVVYDGVLVSHLEADYFYFTTDHPEDTYDEIQIDLQVSGQELVAFLKVFDSEGELIFKKVASGPGESISYSFITMGASFFVRVSGWDPSLNRDHGTYGAYTLRARNLFVNDEFLGNHSFERAADIELDRRYHGSIVSEDEADYFGFTTAHTAREFDTVVIEVQVHDPSLMAHLQLLDRFGNRSNIVDTASRPGESLAIGYISPGGVRYFRVSGWDPSDNRDHGSTGRYSFMVRNLDNNDPYMGNHRFEDAYPVELDRNYNAILLCISETDWFRVDDAEPGRSYKIIGKSDPSMALRMEVYDSRGRFVDAFTAESYGGDVSGAFLNESESFTIRFSGWNIAWALDMASRGPYSFRVEQVVE